MPYVTGKEYMIWWGSTGIDFTLMALQINDSWTVSDRKIKFTHPYTEKRDGGFTLKTSSLDGSNLVTGSGALTGSASTW
jgi:hypothetical protein